MVTVPVSAGSPVFGPTNSRRAGRAPAPASNAHRPRARIPYRRKPAAGGPPVRSFGGPAAAVRLAPLQAGGPAAVPAACRPGANAGLQRSEPRHGRRPAGLLTGWRLPPASRLSRSGRARPGQTSPAALQVGDSRGLQLRGPTAAAPRPGPRDDSEAPGPVWTLACRSGRWRVMARHGAGYRIP